MHINIGTALSPRYGGISKYLSQQDTNLSVIYDVSLFGRFHYPKNEFCRQVSFIKLIYLLCSYAKNYKHITISFHGAFTIYPLLIPFLLSSFGNIEYKFFPHGMLYKIVLSSSNIFLKSFWINLFGINVKIFNIAIMCLSKSEQDQSNSIYPYCVTYLSPPCRFSTPVIPNLDHFVHEKFFKRSFKYVMFCRYSPEKQIDKVIQAFKKLDIESASLDIYGDYNFDSSYYTYCSSLASSHNNIRLNDFIPSSEVYRILLESHFCIVYSTKENLSFTLIEAALRCNVIISNINVGAVHFFNVNDIFISDKPYDIDSLTCLLKTSSSCSLSLLKKMAVCSYNTAITRFCSAS